MSVFPSNLVFNFIFNFSNYCSNDFKVDEKSHELKVYRMAFGVTGDTLVNNPLFESEIMCAMTLRFANVDYKKFRVELLQQPGFKARVQVILLQCFFILAFYLFFFNLS